MKILLPIDFSPASTNATNYAMQLAQQYDGSTVFLMHCYETEQDTESDEIADIMEAKKYEMQMLQNKLFDSFPVHLDSEIQVGSFRDAVAISLDNHDIDMVVMGVNSGFDTKKNYVENHAMQVVELERCPVLIVPPHVQFRPINKACLAVKLEEATKHLPASTMSAMVKLLQAQLNVLSINPDYYIELTENQKALKEHVASILDVPAEFFFLRLYDVDEAIDYFVKDNKVDLLITIPHHAGIFGYTASRSHTARMSYESKVAVLAIPSNLG